MGRMKAFYFDNLTNDEDDIYGDLLKDFDLKLPSEKELRKVEKLVKKTQKEDYAELTGVDPETI
jgi:hypothetical protein